MRRLIAGVLRRLAGRLDPTPRVIITTPRGIDDRAFSDALARHARLHGKALP